MKSIEVKHFVVWGTICGRTVLLKALFAAGKMLNAMTHFIKGNILDKKHFVERMFCGGNVSWQQNYYFVKKNILEDYFLFLQKNSSKLQESKNIEYILTFHSLTIM